MLADVIGRVLIAVHDENAPEDSEWERLVRLGVKGAKVVLVSTDGGAPTAKQRAFMKAHSELISTTTAVMTPSAIARGVATALGWLGMTIKPFRPGDLNGAGEHLALSPEELQDCRIWILRGRAQLAGATSFDDFRTRLGKSREEAEHLLLTTTIRELEKLIQYGA